MKPAVPPQRPGFPARLPNASNPQNGSKSIAINAIKTPATAAILKNKALIKPAAAPLSFDSRAVRDRMVQKLAAQGLADARVLAAMGLVERHRFVDSALSTQAYEDTSLPIGLGQTISKPNVVARMLELLMQGALFAKNAQGMATDKLGRVLEIGTGCGYQAALLSHLATEVYSIERLRGLHDKSRDNLRGMRVANLHLLFGDGMLGYAKGAPYAGIIAAAGGEALPTAWIDQLAVGGRLVAPVQGANGAQALVVVDKTAQGVRQTMLEPVHFVPLKSGTS